MCGASQDQKDAQAAEAALTRQTMEQSKTIFAQNQSILKSISDAFTPIVAAGVNQEGYSPAELAAMRTMAADTTAQGAQQAQVAAGARAAATGGEAVIPSGAQQQINAMINSSAANENARLQTGITSDDYATGRQNFFAAEGALAGAPVGLEGAATNAAAEGVNAADTYMKGATTVKQANSGWVSSLTGLIGGLGGAALGNPALLGGKK